MMVFSTQQVQGIGDFHSATIEQTVLGQNFDLAQDGYGQTFDLIGDGILEHSGIFGTFGPEGIKINWDASGIYVGLKECALPIGQGANNFLLFIDLSNTSGVSSLANLGDSTASSMGTPDFDHLDCAENLSFGVQGDGLTPFRPDIGIVVGDEWGDGNFPSFVRPQGGPALFSSGYDSGQGVVDLVASTLHGSFAAVPLARIQQYDSSPQIVDDSDGDQDANYIEIFIPSGTQGFIPRPGAVLELAAVVAGGDSFSYSRPDVYFSTTYVGGSGSSMPAGGGPHTLDSVRVVLQGGAWIHSPARSGAIRAGDGLRFSAASATTNAGGTTFLWDFGDGRTSDLQAPGVITFTVPGTNIVRLYTVDPPPLGTNLVDTRTLVIVPATGAVPDLIVSTFSVPAGMTIGQATTLTYTVRNAGDAGIAAGAWRDCVYLSEDSYLDKGDTPLSTGLVAVTVTPGGSYTNSMAIKIPVQTPENAYHLLLSIDDAWQLLEQHKLNNEYAVPIDLVTPRLTNGVAVAGSLTGIGDSRIYRIDVPVGKSLRVILDDLNNQGFNEVYLRFGAYPTRGQYDYRQEAVGADQQILVPSLAPGTWYILVYSASSGGTGDYHLTAEVQSIELTGVTPARHANSMDAVLTLKGAGFLPSTRAILVGAGGTAYTATVSEVDSFTQITATFASNTVPQGAYTLRAVRPDNESAELTGGFQMTAAGQPNLQTKVIVPSVMGYHGVATIYVEYANTGTAAMPAPLLVLTPSQNGHQRAFLTLKQQRLVKGFWTSAEPEGFSHSIQFLASGSIPGTLQPGETYRVPVYYAGWQQDFTLFPNGFGWDFSYPPISWDLGVVKADDTTAVNWAEFKDSMKPPTISADAWNVLWANFTTQVGSTWGSYVTMLDDNASYLGRLGERVLDLGDLLSFEFLQADGMNPMRSLASGVDATMEASGLPLTFNRSFAQSVSRRYELGPLGRGWSHNWQYSLAVGTDGTVTVTGPGGSQRVFQPDSRNSSYFAQTGDHGILRSLGSGRFSLQELNGHLSVFRADGKLDYIEELNGNRITAGYAGANLTSLTHSSGRSLQIAYNGFGHIQSITDSMGRQTIYSYDAGGEHLVQVQPFDGRTTLYAYGSGSALHAITNISGSCCSQRSFVYDAQGRLARTCVGASEAAVNFGYEGPGCVTVRDATGNTSRVYFDYRGLMAKSENALGNAVHMDFDDSYNLVEVTDPAGRAYRYGYDSKGNLTSSTDPLGGITRFAFAGPWNRLSAVTDAKSNGTRYSYTPQGNLQSITYADGSAELWGYNATGQPTAWTNRRGQAIGYAFGPDNRLTLKSYPGGTNAIYEYDLRGNLVAASNETGRQVYTYDSKDRLTRIDYPFGPWLQFTYNEAGKRASSLDQLGHKLNYFYDSAGRLESMTDENTNRVVLYTYDAVGRMSRKTVGNGMYTTYKYDAAGQVTNLVNILSNSTVISRFDYTYDNRGRRVSMDTLDGKWDYGYDDLDQLTHAVFASRTNDIPDQDLTYIYDALGNRIRTIENGVTNEYTANNMNQYTRTVASDGKTNTYTFDTDGNLVSEVMTGGGQPTTTNRYTFNTENRLVGFANATSSWQNIYDPQGNRVITSTDGNTIRYMIDPIGFGNVVGEYNVGGGIIARYAHGAGLVFRADSIGNQSYFAFDAVGNGINAVIGGSSAHAPQFYRPYGERFQSANEALDRFGFGGEFGALHENNLVYMRARYYEPSIGRFASQDPIGLRGSDVNLYRYVSNEPLSFIDPSGLAGLIESIERWATIIGKLRDERLRAEEYGAMTGDYRSADRIIQRIKEVNAQMIPQIGKEVSGYYRNMFVGGPILKGLGQLLGQFNQVLGLFFDLAMEVDEWRVFLPWAFDSERDNAMEAALQAAANASDGGTSATTGSTDPNQKTGPAGYGQNGHVAANGSFAYRIDFENFTNALAPAQQVVITDQLSTNLDWTTFELNELGFGDQLISVPANRQYFETTVPMTFSNVTFDVQIEAGVNLGNGQMYATFYSIDPSNGLPPAVDIGFLPPEDGTGRGMGHVSYTLKAKTNLVHGTEIRNVAHISFDNQPAVKTDQVDPLDPSQGTDPTKQCLNTIDTVAPVSSATAQAPVVFGTALLVSWAGADDGAGIGSFDVYVRDEGGPWQLWKSGETNTSGVFTGIVCHTYGFRTVARDYVGNVEVATTSADTEAILTTNTPPVITPVSNLASAVGQLVEFTNTATDAHTPATNLLFSLTTNSPAGATIGPTNGIVSWTPTCEQGRRTNVIGVVAIDDGCPYMTATQSVKVYVTDCLQVGLGRGVVPSGQADCIPFIMTSSDGLTSLVTTIAFPSGSFSAIQFVPTAAEIQTATVTAVTATSAVLRLIPFAGQLLQGPKQMGRLCLTVASGEPSGFTRIRVAGILGQRNDGVAIGNTSGDAGRMVVVGQEPLLEILPATNGTPELILYGIPGSTQRVMYSASLLSTQAWQTWSLITLTNLFRTTNAPQSTGKVTVIKSFKLP